MRTLTLSLALLAILSCSSPPPPADPAEIRLEPYLGIDPALFFDAPTPMVQAIVLPDVAGRIVHYSLDGDNILWDNPDETGRARPGGGFGLYLGPEPRTVPESQVIWRSRHKWAKLGSNMAVVSSEDCPVLGVKVDKQVVIESRTGALDLLLRVKNTSTRNQSYCIWDRTLCKAGGYTIIPLNPKSRFAQGWVIGRRNARAWDYNGTDPYHEGVKVLDGMLVAHSKGKEQKIGADSDAGWIAYARGRLLFVKYYPYFPDGKYTDAGMSVAHYYNERLAELEPISPEADLKPGGEYVFPERWVLIRLDRDVRSHEDARAAAERIPPHDFFKRK